MCARPVGAPVADRRREREGRLEQVLRAVAARVAVDVAVGHVGLEVGEQGEPRSGARDEVEHATNVAVAHVLHHLPAEDQVGGPRQLGERDHVRLHEARHVVALDEVGLDHLLDDVQADV